MLHTAGRTESSTILFDVGLVEQAVGPQILIRSISSTSIWLPVRSQTFVVFGDSRLAMASKCSKALTFLQ
jgi:hypothetical protein